MKRHRWMVGAGVGMAIGMITVGPLWAQAAGTTPAASLLSVSGTLKDTLQRLQSAGKPVELVLRNGKSYRGNLGEVGDHTVIIRQIEGKEYYDALIQLRDVSSIEVRAR